jgi:hypothetical protein
VAWRTDQGRVEGDVRAWLRAEGAATFLAGLWLGLAPLQIAGAILVAHIGADRTLGYGLKYRTAFSDTHLGRIGRR